MTQDLAEKKRHHQAFLRARVALVLMFLLLWFVLFAADFRMPYGYLAVLTVEEACLGVFLFALKRVQREQSLDRLHFLLLALELVFHSALFYYLGGLSWLGAIAYIYATIYATVFLTVRQAIGFAGAVTVSFLSVVALDGTGTLPHQWYLPQNANRFQNIEFIVPTAACFLGVTFTVTIWMMFLAGELRRERDVAVRANIELVKAEEELLTLNEELEQKIAERTRVLAFRAEHDQLTGLLNRGAISRRCQELLALARRGNRQLSVIIADGDAFKSCNDTGGHVYGDRVLRTLGDCLRESSRESDLIGRLGGDEFLIVLPDTSARGALRYCRRVLRAIAERRATWGEPHLPMPSLSLGLAVFPSHGSEVEELIRIADKAMYEAKAAGGNRAKVAPGDEKPRRGAAHTGTPARGA